MATIEGTLINGRRQRTERTYPVFHKYRGDVLANVAEAGPKEIDEALSAATSALTHPIPIHRRYQILDRAADLLAAHQDELAGLMAQEAGKPLTDSRGEVQRGEQTLRYSAIAAKTLAGEEVAVAGNPGSENRLAFTIRKPFGIVLAITPFNFPLNLVLHKVGPALAGGNAVVVKPAPATPLTALRVAELLLEAGLPPGWLQVLTGEGPELGAALVADPRVQLISFTGSAKVGQAIRQAAGLRPVILELGNNSANIVHADADIVAAAQILARRAFAYAGQVCISVQRIYLHESIADAFTEQFLTVTRSLKVGDPEESDTDIGPMINEAAAERADGWVDEAIRDGARTLLRGTRQGAVLPPVVLIDILPSMRVVAEEAFAPLADLAIYQDLEQALAWSNDSPYGLQAGIFTRSLDVAFHAARVLEVGGLIINDSSSYRADNMPYGGVKASGFGREGPAYAIDEMTYPTTVVLNLATS